MAVSVRKPVLYAFGVVLCAGIIGGIWLWYRTHCVLITNDSRIEGTLVGVASRLSDRVVQVMVNEGDTVHKGQGLVRIDSRSVMA
ncbi:MAG: biotin/lipoyl-binding protein, partial [Bilophila wadsworthia]